MELYRSGHNEHDWKSCCRDERHVGSNPTVSAKQKRVLYVLFFAFYITEMLIVPKNFSFEGEEHNFWEFVYVDKGEVIISADKDKFTLKKVKLYFINQMSFTT